MRRRNNDSVNGSFLPTTSDGFRSSYSSSSSKDVNGKKKRGVSGFFRGCGIFLVIIILVICCAVSRSQITNARRKLTRLEKRTERQREHYNTMKNRGNDDLGYNKKNAALTAKVSKAERELELKKRKVDVLKISVSESDKAKMELIATLEQYKRGYNPPTNIKAEEGLRNELEAHKKRENVLFDRMLLLQTKIQKESHRAVNLLFGPGPHYVKFNLSIPEEGSAKEEASFVVQLAPLDLMPHSVHMFLEQVKHQLWDGSTFVINAPHILQASVSRRSKFDGKNLGALSFQEYNAGFPHQKYTLGLAGRPSGPDFYINKMDNTDNHGPGGQGHHVLDEEGEPCFAKIVEGFSIMDKVSSRPVKGANMFMIKPVTIVSAVLLGSDYVPPNSENEKEDFSSVF